MAVPVFTTGAALTQADLSWMILTKPITQVYASSSQSMTGGTYIPVNLDTEIIDRYNMHSGSSSQITIGLELGWYRVRGTVNWVSGGAAGVNYLAVIRKNGTTFIHPYRQAPAISPSVPATTSVEILIQSTVNTDYIELMAGTSGATRSTLGSGQGAILSVEFMGT
jgi:hypothetical protein